MTPRLALFLLLVAGHTAMATPARAAWSPDGDALCTATGDQFKAVAIPDGAGGAIVAWQDQRNGSDYDVFAQRVNGLGDPLWATDGVSVCTMTGSQTNVTVCSDGSRGAIIAWEDYRDSPLDSDIYAIHLNDTGAVGAGWATNGTLVCDAAFFQGSPAVVSDGAGGAILAWEDLRNDTLYQVFTLRLLAGGAAAPGWTANGVALAGAGGNQYRPGLVPDGAGGAYGVWSDDRDPGYLDSGLYAQRITGDATRATGWPAAGLLVCAGGSSPAAAAIVAEDAGGAYVAWQDRRGADTDVFAQRLLPAGTVAWAPNGAAVCALRGEQGAPGLVADHRGGVIVAWDDERDGDGAVRVFTQRLDSLAAPAWITDGVALAATGERLGEPFLSEDGEGGAIVTFQTYSSDNTTDIRAQRITAAGTLPWGVATPVAVCTAAGSQQAPRPVTDGAGGAIIAWHDNRSNPTSSTYDIYAQRVAAGGTISTADVPQSAAMGLALDAPRPNPTSGRTELRFVLPAAGDVTATVWDIAGRFVRRLASGLTLGAGSHALVCDGRDEQGAPVAPGIYLARLTAGRWDSRCRLVRLR